MAAMTSLFVYKAPTSGNSEGAPISPELLRVFLTLGPITVEGSGGGGGEEEGVEVRVEVRRKVAREGREVGRRKWTERLDGLGL